MAEEFQQQDEAAYLGLHKFGQVAVDLDDCQLLVGDRTCIRTGKLFARVHGIGFPVLNANGVLASY